jgi:hypothetical protein
MHCCAHEYRVHCWCPAPLTTHTHTALTAGSVQACMDHAQRQQEIHTGLETHND